MEQRVCSNQAKTGGLEHTVMSLGVYDYPACVGLVKIGTWSLYQECWNDGISRRPRLLLRYIPWQIIDWNRKGSYLSFKKLFK